MAAQAVEVTLSGHVNRALFIVDSDDRSTTPLVDESGTASSVRDNATSGTRIRVRGEGEMMDGGSAGVLLEYTAGGSLGLRYAEVYFSGDYGKVSIGHGDQGGEGSVYHGGAAVWGTGPPPPRGRAIFLPTRFDPSAGRSSRLPARSLPLASGSTSESRCLAARGTVEVRCTDGNPDYTRSSARPRGFAESRASFLGPRASSPRQARESGAASAVRGQRCPRSQEDCDPGKPTGPG